MNTVIKCVVCACLVLPVGMYVWHCGSQNIPVNISSKNINLSQLIRTLNPGAGVDLTRYCRPIQQICEFDDGFGPRYFIYLFFVYTHLPRTVRARYITCFSHVRTILCLCLVFIVTRTTMTGIGRWLLK